MSSNYSAQQYNDAYLPHRLGNWEIPADRDYDQRPRLQPWSHHYHGLAPYFLVSNLHGRLLPTIKEKLLYRKEHAAWEQLSKIWFGECDCARRRQHARQSREKEDMSRSTGTNNYRIPSFFRRKGNKQKQPRPPPPKKEVDPYLVYLRELGLPTIWIMGVPKANIRHKRKQLCREIADELDFAYVDLDECIENWTRRQVRQHQQLLPQRDRLLDSDTLMNKNDLFTVPSYRNSKQMSSPKQPLLLAGENRVQPDPWSITFSTSKPFSTEKVLDLLKFAMIEALPSRGFVLDGFPCNLEEAAEFERHFYPASLALYFVTGANKKKNVEADKNEYLAFPLRFRRRFQFSLESGEMLCARRNYGWKVIRILDTENVDKDTLSFLHQVIRDNLERDREDGAIDIDVVGDQELPDPLISEDVILATTSDGESKVTSSRGDIRNLSATRDHKQRQHKLVSLPPPLLIGSSSISSHNVASLRDGKQLPEKNNPTGDNHLEEQYPDGGGAGDNGSPETPQINKIHTDSSKNSLSSSCSASIIFLKNPSNTPPNNDEMAASPLVSSNCLPLKKENLEDRPLPLPSHGQTDAWWCNNLKSRTSAIRQNQSPKTPPSSPCGDKINNIKECVRHSELSQQKSSLEVLSDWFDMGEVDDNDKEEKCHGDDATSAPTEGIISQRDKDGHDGDHY